MRRMLKLLENEKKMKGKEWKIDNNLENGSR